MIIKYILTWLFFGALLLAARQDVAHMRIDNRYFLFILGLSVAGLFLAPGMSWRESCAGFLGLGLPLFFLRLFFPGSLGGGDVKLVAACGAFLGWERGLVGAYAAFLGAGLWALSGRLLGGNEKKEGVALGPFLAAGMFLGAVAGQVIFQAVFA